MLNKNNICKSKLNLLWSICVLFYSSFVRTSAYANVYFKTKCECIRQINIHRSEVHCGSVFEPGGSSLPYYCTPPVCVPDVFGALAVWRLSKKKMLAWECRSIRSGFCGLPSYCAPLVCVPDVIWVLAVWWHNKPQTQSPRIHGSPQTLSTVLPTSRLGLKTTSAPRQFVWVLRD